MMYIDDKFEVDYHFIRCNSHNESPLKFVLFRHFYTVLQHIGKIDAITGRKFCKKPLRLGWNLFYLSFTYHCVYSVLDKSLTFIILCYQNTSTTR